MLVKQAYKGDNTSNKPCIQIEIISKVWKK